MESIMAGKGGKTPGAGRKKNGHNKLRAEAERIVQWTGITPAEFFQSIMHDETQPLAVRMDAAKAARDLVHKKMPESREGGKIEISDPRLVVAAMRALMGL